MTNYDSPWKETLEVYFQAFLALLFSNIHDDIDWSRGYEFLDKELLEIMPEAAHGKGEVDKLVKVWLKDGSENWLLLHVEVQAQEEAGFTLRMFVYNYRIFDRYNREVISLAVLGDDRANWRPKLYRSERWGCHKEFGFPIVKLLDWLPRTAELEASRNPVAKIVLAHLRALETRQQPESRRLWKFQLVRHLYDGGMDAREVRQLFRLIDWMMTLPPELERRFKEDVHELEKEKHMPYVTSIERMAKEEGRQEGRQESLHDGIAVCLKIRFADQGKVMMTEIQKISDIDQLKRILAALERDLPVEEFKKLIVSSR